MIPTNTPIFNAGAPKTEVKYPFTRISFPNSVWVTAFGSASMSEEMPNSAPVITLIRIKAITDAKAPPARSFAQEPPIATAKDMQVIDDGPANALHSAPHCEDHTHIGSCHLYQFSKADHQTCRRHNCNYCHQYFSQFL